MKIQINEKSKINNPTEFIPADDPSFVCSYEGVFQESFFKDINSQYESYLKHQVSNLDNLINYLNNIGLQMEYIWLIVFTNEVGSATSSFVIKTNTNEEGLKIFWRKYNSKAVGSGHNDLFLVKDPEFVQEGCVNKIKVKLTDYFRNSNFYLDSI